MRQTKKYILLQQFYNTIKLNQKSNAQIIRTLKAVLVKTAVSRCVSNNNGHPSKTFNNKCNVNGKTIKDY